LSRPIQSVVPPATLRGGRIGCGKASFGTRSAGWRSNAQTCYKQRGDKWNRSRDSPAAAKARHATSALQLITAPPSTLSRAAYAATGRIAAEEIDLQSPSKFDGATARPAQLSPDKRCRLLRAPQSDLRTHVVDVKASAPYLEHYFLQQRRRPSESIESGLPCRVDRHNWTTSDP